MHHPPAKFPAKLFFFGCFLLLLGFAGLQIHWFSTNPWMSARLAPSVALAQGLPIYPSPAGGPYAVTLYGFIGPFFYLPFAWIQDVDWALRAAGVWTMLWTVGLGLLLVRGEFKRQGLPAGEVRLERRVLLTLFCLVIIACPSLRYSLLEVHADAPAHLGVLLCAMALLKSSRAAKWGWVAIAGLLAGTAPWAKQVAVFPLCGAALWVLIQGGWKRLLVFGTAAALMGGIWLAVGIYRFGSDAILFNLLQVPSQQPWVLKMPSDPRAVFALKEKLLALFVLTYHELLWDFGPLLVLLFGATTVLWRCGRERAASFWQAYPAQGLFLLITLCAIPSMVLGLVKEGGDVNSASFFTYGATITIFLVVVALLPALKERQLFAPFAILSAVGVGVVTTLVLAQRVHLSKWPAHRALQEYVRQHPGEIYNPFDPMVHLAEEKRMPPVSDILYSMELAGHRVTPQQFAESFRGYEKIKYLVYPTQIVTGERHVSELLPAYSQRTTLAELPGFRIYQQPIPVEPAPPQ